MTDDDRTEHGEVRYATQPRTPAQERFRRSAENIEHACNRYGWTRQRLASEAAVDIRTVNRAFDGACIKQRSLRRIAGALKLWNPYDLILPPEQFVRRMDEVINLNRSLDHAATLRREPARRAPWYKTLFHRIFG